MIIPTVNSLQNQPSPNLNKQITLEANFRQRINFNRCIHVKRVMVGKGKLIVSEKEEVKPQDIIGKSSLSGGFTVINIAKKLGVSPTDGLNFLQRPIGKNIYSGELLAYKKGLFGKKYIISPTDGVIDDYNPERGELRLQFLPKEIFLTAGVNGIVEKVDQMTGEAYIKTLVTEVFGVYGSGKERIGNLSILGGKGDLLHPSKIGENLRQHIIVGGGLIYGEALRKAAGFGAYGIISGGLNASDYKTLINSIDPRSRVGSDIGMTILATEGFGPIPIGDDVYELLRAYDGRFVILYGNSSRLLLPSLNPDSILSLRKINLPITKLPEIAPEVIVNKIELGSKIRIIWPPFMGYVGNVLGVDATVTRLDSGISTYLLTVETASRKIKVPYTNVELI